MKIIVTIFSILFLTINGSSQSTKNDYFALLSYVKQDTVLLRWAPLSPKLLKSGLEYGFTVDRITVSSGTEFENNATLKTIVVPAYDDKLEPKTKEEKEFKQLIMGYLNSSSMKESEQEYTYGVLLLASSANRKLSEMLNLGIVDTDIDNKETYRYRVGLSYKYPKALALKVNTTELSRDKKLTKLTGKADQKRKEAFLKWEAESLQSSYSAYWIERSTDSLNFQRINKTPYVFFKSADEKEKVDIDFVDKTVEEGITYWYRVQGINHFAEVGEKSNMVSVSLKRRLTGLVKIDTVIASGLDRIVRGKYESNNSDDFKNLKGFVLLKSEEMHTGFSIVGRSNLVAKKYEFTTSGNLSSGDRNYYKVGAISVDDDTIYSYTKYFFTLDQIPPSRPTNLKGTVDDAGVVKLNWNKNPEDDIRGYRVFRSNSMDEEFIETTANFIDTILYTDTLPLNNLTSEIYYRIAAVDLNYNNSMHSESVMLLKPDTIPPVACLFVKYSSEANGMVLNWINSSSEDVVENKLLLRNSIGADSVIANWSDTLSSFVDSTAILGKKRTYYIQTDDKSGNKIQSKDITVVFETGRRKSVNSFKAESNIEKKEIHLGWSIPMAKIYSLKIYRAKNDGPYKLIKTTRDLDSQNYIDKDLSINNTYLYKVQIVYQSGVKSEYSKVVEVVY